MCAAAFTNPNISKYSIHGESMLLFLDIRSNTAPNYGSNYFIIRQSLEMRSLCH